ncbi:hypothetical protein [Flavivirga sp. 57AJ16]|uniref:hypothetical protein n=1 Tax=Flavivirga sp. 57AJ16 TaxID=3025307 RepID=UPI002365FD21|nr:hypothetical protein [Flavivirga sp. 57AJ16]MDD7888275.1 hypothetical protein [Flavivirga sp. 57AJ16]
MRTLYKTLMGIALLLSGLQIQAQAIEMDFSLTSDSFSLLGSTIPAQSKINKTGGALTLEQIIGGQKTTTSFAVEDITGQWDENTGLGEVVCTMTLQGHTSIFRLTGTDQGMTVKLTFGGVDMAEGDYVFDINTINYQ